MPWDAIDSSPPHSLALYASQVVMNNIEHMFTEELLGQMDPSDFEVSSASSGASNPSADAVEGGAFAGSTKRRILLGVKQDGVQPLSFDCELGYSASEQFHYFNVGCAEGRKPCVTLTLTDESIGGTCTLQGVHHNGRCCVGGGMMSGRRGTVPMVRGALKAAAQLEPFRGCSSVCLTDNSYKPSTGTSCADFHIITHASLKTWYEEEFGAVVLPTWAAQLQATRDALSRPVSGDASRFCKAALAAAQTQGLLPWWRRTERAVKAAFETEPRRPWSQLLASLVVQFDDDRGHMSRTLLTLLACGEMCPGWTSSANFGWSIPIETVIGWGDVEITML
jgi:hypothetical protein